MDIKKRTALSREIKAFIDHMNINSPQCDRKQAEQELKDIQSQDYSAFPNARPLLKKLVSSAKEGTTITLMYANKLIGMIEPPKNDSHVINVLDHIQKQSTPSNVAKSLSAVKNAFPDSDWFGTIDSVFHALNISYGEDWTWVLRHAVHDGTKPAEYADLYSELKKCYPYYKIEDWDTADWTYKIAEPVTQEDVGDVILRMKRIATRD